MPFLVYWAYIALALDLPVVSSLSQILALLESARILDFGLGEYHRILGLQELLHTQRLANEISDVWMIGEHPTVITQGIRGTAEDLVPSQPSMAFSETAIPIVTIDRGGMTTLHNPGQLIVYPIVKLTHGSLGTGKFARSIVVMMKEWIAAEFGIQAEQRSGHPGLFAEGKKLLSVGVSGRGGVTMHGIALNMCNDLEPWRRIVACGEPDIAPVTLTQLTGREIKPSNQTESLARRIRETWGYRSLEITKTSA